MPDAACPRCGAVFSHPEGMTRGVCPTCKALLTVVSGKWAAAPDEAPPPHAQPTSQQAAITCPSCCTENDANNYKCVACGDPLRPEQAPAPTPAPSGLDALIPYRNSAALAAYYCGVFSLIPCVGLVLAIVAIAFGVQGLGVAREHPEAKGRTHATVGIVLGTLVLIGHAIAIIAMVAANS